MKNMKLLTIITPTYNRARLIVNLYHSLEKQTNNDFYWMVVDDGSKDNTFEVINSLTAKASFEITYLKKENGGKHTALNYGVKQIKTPLTMIIDSDDCLTYDAVQSILNVHKKYLSDDSISSYTFLRGYSSDKPIVSVEKDEFIANYIQYRIKNHRPGDMAEAFKTKFLKEFPFPEYPGEKFISEDVVWIEIGKYSNSVYINKVIYLCKYLEGGLTDNDKKMKFSSPLGSMMRGIQLMSKECGLKENIRGAIIYDVYRREVENNEVNKKELTSRERFLVLFASLFSFIFYKKWHKEI